MLALIYLSVGYSRHQFSSLLVAVSHSDITSVPKVSRSIWTCMVGSRETDVIST